MPDIVSYSQLYKSFTHMALLEAQLGKMPLDPFQATDRERLAAQSDLAGSCATRVRQSSIDDIGDLTVAQACVNKATAEMSAILNAVPTSLTRDVVFGDVQTAIFQVNAVLPESSRMTIPATG